MRYWSSNSIFILIDNFFITHKSPIFLGYFWNFGVFAFLCLFIQIITGLFLAIHYNGNTLDAFNSVEHIMRDVNNGWFLRYSHANGASFFLLQFIFMFFEACTMVLLQAHVSQFGILVRLFFF